MCLDEMRESSGVYKVANWRVSGDELIRNEELIDGIAGWLAECLPCEKPTVRRRRGEGPTPEETCDSCPCRNRRPECRSPEATRWASKRLDAFRFRAVGCCPSGPSIRHIAISIPDAICIRPRTSVDGPIASCRRWYPSQFNNASSMQMSQIAALCTSLLHTNQLETKLMTYSLTHWSHGWEWCSAVVLIWQRRFHLTSLYETPFMKLKPSPPFTDNQLPSTVPVRRPAMQTIQSPPHFHMQITSFEPLIMQVNLAIQSCSWIRIALKTSVPI